MKRIDVKDPGKKKNKAKDRNGRQWRRPYADGLQQKARPAVGKVMDLCKQDRISVEPDDPARATGELSGKKLVMKEFTPDSVLGIKRPEGCNSLDHRHLGMWEGSFMQLFVQELNITRYCLMASKRRAGAGLLA